VEREQDFTILLRDDEGIGVSEAKDLVDSISRIIGVAPRLNAQRAISQPDGHIRSTDALYQVFSMSLEPGAIAAASAAVLRSLTKVISATIEASKSRKVELWLSDGTHVLLEGRDATPEKLGDALSKLTNPSSPSN
jgi:hypothetical protein